MILKRSASSETETGRSAVARPTHRQALAVTTAAVTTAAAALVLCFPFTGAQAQSAIDTPPLAAQIQLDGRRGDLNATAGKATALEADVTNLGAERERLNTRLVETAALIQRSEAKLTSIEGRLLELEAQEKIVRGSLGQRHGQIATLLGALQRMGRNPPPVLITRREDALKMVRSAMLLSSAFPELKGQALKLTERLDDLVRVMGDIRTEGERLQVETDRLQESRTRLTSLMEAKKLTIADRQQELVAVRAASAEITKNVTDLTELITRLDQAVTANVKTLGAYQAEAKPAPPADVPTAQVATTLQSRPIVITPEQTTAASETVAKQTAPTPPADVLVETAANPPSESQTRPAALTVTPPLVLNEQPSASPAKDLRVAAVQPPRLKPQIIEIAPSTATLMPGNAGRIKPAIPFASARAKLPIPAQGRRALAFGERTQYGGQSKGVVIETRNGAQITAPCDGWIVYAGEFRSYGQLLIINAGDGYHILLAGLSQIDVQPGQFVLAAEPVGTMAGVATRSANAGQVGAPVLYVEFRKDGRPIDPDPWWASGQQKVQG